MKVTMPGEIATYQVGSKMLLRKDGKILFLKCDDEKWDLPGGRIDAIEHLVRLEDILAREIREELGPEVRYRVVKPAVHFRRYYRKIDKHIFLVAFEAEHESGDIALSHEHIGHEWIDPADFQLKGV